MRALFSPRSASCPSSFSLSVPLAFSLHPASCPSHRVKYLHLKTLDARCELSEAVKRQNETIAKRVSKMDEQARRAKKMKRLLLLASERDESHFFPFPSQPQTKSPRGKRERESLDPSLSGGSTASRGLPSMTRLAGSDSGAAGAPSEEKQGIGVGNASSASAAGDADPDSFPSSSRFWPDPPPSPSASPPDSDNDDALPHAHPSSVSSGSSGDRRRAAASTPRLRWKPTTSAITSAEAR